MGQNLICVKVFSKKISLNCIEMVKQVEIFHTVFRSICPKQGIFAIKMEKKAIMS